jgi:histone acetyltransferase (RNA polymerase elongator complex component)
MLRAIGTRTKQDSYDFDVKSQFQNRIQAYKFMGNIDKTDTKSKKMEVILSGGTWESYPKEYREQVMLELYWAANTMTLERPIRTLQEEIEENETAEYRIIGLTIETRPDNITKESICDYNKWGVTRVQIGVQHFDDAILKKINRKITFCYFVMIANFMSTIESNLHIFTINLASIWLVTDFLTVVFSHSPCTSL